MEPKRVHVLNTIRFALCVTIAMTGTARPGEFDLTKADIPEIQQLMDRGILTSERLVQMYINRIATYDKNGPSINSIINLNARALHEAVELDKERISKGKRSQLHGIPVIVKDNIDTADTPTTGGAIALKHSYPRQDAFVIRKLKEAGAIIIAKSNLSEFASGARGLTGASSLGGQPRNPYNLRRHADSSSSGTGAALAAVFGQVGLGSETGSSNRGPSAHNNLTGLTPTEGMISRGGVIPLSYTLDRVGIMARSVTDLAITFNHVLGVDYSDQITRQSIGNIPDKPYESYLDKYGLKGARLGVFREVFTSDDPRCQEAIALTEKALDQMKAAGAVLIDPITSGIPDIMEQLALSEITPHELRDGLNQYFLTLGPESPIGSLEDLIKSGGILWNKFETYNKALVSPSPSESPVYIEQVQRRSYFRNKLNQLMDENNLDALVYLHNMYPPQYINEPHPYTKVRLSSVSGLPGMIVQGGFTEDDQPVGIEFLARPFCESTLFRIGYAFEQVSRNRRHPASTPALETDILKFTEISASSVEPASQDSGTFDLLTATVQDINEALDKNIITIEKLAGMCIERINAYDQVGPRLNSVIAIHPRALELARELDKERKEKGPRSPLHGIPVLLKDNYDTFDMPTTGASKALIGSMAPDDASTVKSLRDAGALILAKVNLSELARSGVSISSLMGQTLNPYDLTRTPGGSSGGTGAAIAATFGILGTGSDTGQSTRSPSSANNCVGIRPTFGLISRDGIIPISYTQDTAGPITRYVADAAVMMDFLVGFDEKDPSTWHGVDMYPSSYTNHLNKDGLKGARIGYVLDAFGSDEIHKEVTKITYQQISIMKELGATMVPVSIPEVSENFKDLKEISVSSFESVPFMDLYFSSLGGNAKFRNTAEYVAAGLTHPPILERLKENLELVDPLNMPEYHRRLSNQAAFRDKLIWIMDNLELDALFYPHQRRLVVPTGPNPPVQVDRNGFMASSTGLPAITIQGGFSKPTDDAPIGVPVGIEFLGRPFSEPRLIELAYSFEQHTKYRRTPSSTPYIQKGRISY